MTDTTAIITQVQADTIWLTFFDPYKAIAAVYAHVAALPGSRTKEKHTHKVYEAGLKYFLAWAGDRLPTEDLLTGFVAHLVQKQLKSTTIGSKYLAPVKLYLKKLAGQSINTLDAAASVTQYVLTCKDSIRQAASIPSPRPDVTTNIAPLWRPEFVRLTAQQVNAVLRSMDRSTLIGLRDYALLHIAFSTGLRLAELQRITLGSISQEGDTYLIRVRGKRSNIDPVPVSAKCAADVFAYVEAFNARCTMHGQNISSDTPLWQPLIHGDNMPIVGVNGYMPERGISQQGIRNVIATRTSAALGAKWQLAAHDTRRTAAAIAYEAGMALPDIQALLRHKDAAVTLRYIGTKPDYNARSLSNYVQFG